MFILRKLISKRHFPCSIPAGGSGKTKRRITVAQQQL